MPLVSVTAGASIKWQLDTLLPGFTDLVQSDQGLAFSLQGIDLSKYNQLRADFYNIPAGGTFDFDLWSFTDLTKSLTGFTLQGVILLFVLPKTGNVQIAPSPTNGLSWPYQGVGQSLTPGGVSFNSLPPAGPAQAVSPTSRDIRITNVDVVAATGYFIAVGG